MKNLLRKKKEKLKKKIKEKVKINKMEYIYGALLLHKLGQAVNEDNLKKVIAATGKDVDESKVKVLIASLKDVNIDEQLESAVVAAAPATSEAGSGEGEAKEEKKKEEPKAEAAEGLASLFG
jgi:large subunit ribosomal protein L12